MQINSKIGTFYKDLHETDFPQYIQTTDFERLLSTTDLNKDWLQAEQLAKSKVFDSFFGNNSPDEREILIYFLDILLGRGVNEFSLHITDILLAYLNWTETIPLFDNIIKDLEAIKSPVECTKTLKQAWQNLDNDLLRKITLLKDVATAIATGDISRPESYMRFRDSLMKNKITRNNMPVCICESRNPDEFFAFLKRAKSTYHERRLFISDSFSNLFRKLEALEETAFVNFTIDAFYIQEVWTKALSRLADDPEGAITTARTLLETVCKHILDDKNVRYDEGEELPRLYKQTAISLNLSPDQHTEEIFKQILSGCSNVVNGLGALRNKLSDSHGRGQQKVKPSARHAELAVNLSGSMCNFLLQTFKSN